MPRSTVPKVFKKRRLVGKPKCPVGNTTEHSPNPRPNPEPELSKGASNTKITPNLDRYSEYHSNEFNLIIDTSVFKEMFCKFGACQTCGSNLTINFERQFGLAYEIVVSCTNCDDKSKLFSSPQVPVGLSNLIKPKHLFDINIRYVYGLRTIGKGPTAGKTLAGVMNLPPPPTRFSPYVDVIGKAVSNVAKTSMDNALKEAVEKNDGNSDLSIALDGSWQKRGHTSLNGVVSATSFDTGKVIDVAVRSKFCRCKDKYSNKHEEKCCANYIGVSGGMEISGVKEIFERSLERDVRYEYYLGDGDSKAFQQVADLHLYGQDIELKKLECIGHVQKEWEED